MAKLERYITTLVDERGGVDAGVMETIVKDMEKGSFKKKTQKQVYHVGQVAGRREPHEFVWMCLHARQRSLVTRTQAHGEYPRSPPTNRDIACILYWQVLAHSWSFTSCRSTTA